jgi:DNA-binding IscR family transcriptional regulator
MSDVFTALEGQVVTVECVENDDFCKRSANCPARHLWEQVQQAIFNVLRNKSLQDLINETGEKGKLHYQI